MKIYYEPIEKKWIQNEVPEILLWGNNKCEIEFAGSISKNALPFHISSNEGLAGPLIGILAGESKKKGLIGNFSTFRRLSLSLQKNEALCVVFTPSSISDNGIDGFIYVQAFKKWIKISTPYPNVVYNRIPTRNLEKSKPYSNMFTFLHNNKIPYFNPSFFSKWESYKILAKHPVLSHHIPKTEILTSSTNLKTMLQTHKEIYLKPIEGHKGKGIYKIIYKAPTSINLMNAKEIHTYETLNSLWQKIEKLKETTPYIIQQAIQPDTFNGKRYDLRILAHYRKKRYHISGIGIRLSGDQEVTTHVPNGGKIIPFTKLSNRVDENKLADLVDAIGKQLVEGFGSFIGEFSVDLGISNINGHFYIFEVNSKPMVFDEVEIKNKGLENLTKLLIMRANPHNE